jgi:hypothetical protein
MVHIRYEMQPATQDMAEYLQRLRKTVKIGVVSGSDFQKVNEQFPNGENIYYPRQQNVNMLFRARCFRK